MIRKVSVMKIEKVSEVGSTLSMFVWILNFGGNAHRLIFQRILSKDGHSNEKGKVNSTRVHVICELPK